MDIRYPNSELENIPTLRGEPLYIPFVGAIIQRMHQGIPQILIQTREKKSDQKHSGAIEIPGGKMRAFEDIYITLKREVKEECGLDITFTEREQEKHSYTNNKETSDVVFPFCVTQMKSGPFIGLVFICKAEGEPITETEEARDARWINEEELKQIIIETPERIYTPFLGPLRSYFER